MVPPMLKHGLAVLLIATACGDDGATPATDAPTPTVDGAPDAPSTMAVAIPFAGRVAGQPFACGQSYAGIGTTAAAYVGIDFRFFVHDVKLVAGNGDVPLVLDVNEFQNADGIALLDFETGGAGCQMGTTGTHSMVTGTVPFGTEFSAVKFTVGVPFANNHLDATTAGPPLNVPAMYWAWSSGYKFLKIDGTVGGAGFNVHLGSTGCNGSGQTPPTAPCTNPNTFAVNVGFVPGASTIVADIGPVLAGVDVTVNTPMTAPGCMSFPGDAECNTILPKLGLPYGTEPAGTQTLFFSER